MPDLFNPIPPAPAAPMNPGPVPFAPWNGPAPSPWSNFGYPPNPVPVSCGTGNCGGPVAENMAPFAPAPSAFGPGNRFDQYPIPFITNPGPSFSPAGVQAASPLDGASDEKKSLGDNFSNSDTPALVQHAPPMMESIGKVS